MTLRISSIIVDDELAARDSIEMIVNKEFPFMEIVAKVDNAQDALKLIMGNNIDIVFLDIEMPVNDGFWLASKLNKLHKSISIIFVTAYNEFAVQAIRHSAFDFLLKPIAPEMLKDAVNRFLDNRDRYNLTQKLEKLINYLKQEKLKFNTNLGFAMIAPENIIYCEADKNYCNLFLSNGKVELVTSQLGTIEKKLEPSSFVRISRSSLINLDYLEYFHRKTKTVVLSNVLENFSLKVSTSGSKRLQNSTDLYPIIDAG